ncbi:MAG: PTS ascorbate transporter subunit IIC [Clostridia bacterium]|nr:PTS ascorbate transporter subunit IIC [Clostridia bacterium]
MPENDTGKKQLPLRISKGLYEELARWAEDDFRSLNGQIEYLLTECVRRRRGVKRDADPVPEEFFEKDS